MRYSPEDYKKNNLPQLKEIWESRKEYIEKDLWVIRNFLSDSELEWLNEQANDLSGWYDTMRSPYGANTKNKFLGYIPEYDPISGAMLIPTQNSKFGYREPVGYFEARLKAVMPDHFVGAGALQSFFEVPEEQILAELGYSPDFAMNWHYERDDSDDEDVQKRIVESSKTQGKQILSQGKITASLSIYINDNFDGGILEFKNKDYIISPEPGMLVNVPIYKEFEHRVTKVTNGNRHTVYGRCWDSVQGAYSSTNEDC